MAWDEWEQLKASAAGRSPERMRLNQLPVEGGGAGSTQGDLAVDQKDLAAIGDKAYTLYTDLSKQGKVALPSSRTAAGRLTGDGFALGGALGHVADRWEKSVKSLTDACAHISNHLDFTKKAHAGDEVHVEGTLSSIATLDAGFDESYAPAGAKNPIYGEKKPQKADG
ncbi:hypothetical protein [Streptomyces lichenis]|uniref:Uncharacterized protein n=1 Tax=Streptomyces lichenis TaxID=2306967 RepID=A0ABT0IGF1_9ACTN|nr:hypothetical protein [Streptomyces lichenis]MCK8680410.1 hypothetical protein [Streptomyces lichenis]